MASASTDPQRLIAVSLGKIQAARGQRGGVNLHKNLLVAQMIMKARTIYMMGVHSKASSSESDPEEEEDIEEEEEEEEELEEDAIDGCSTPVSNECNDAPTHEVNNQQLPEDAEAEAETAPTEDPTCVDCDKENSPPEGKHYVAEKSAVVSSSTQKDSDSMLEAPCQRCTKRRFAEDSDVISNNGSKRARVSSSSSSSSHSTSSTTEYRSQSTDSSTQCEPEPMQTESAQISSLVHRFNSGLTGFLCCTTNIQDNNNSTTDSTECNTTNIQHKDSHSISCSSQIKEAFETLARPVALALSV